MNYQFFVYNGIQASVGLHVHGRRLAVHLPAMRATTTGRPRNPGRDALHARLMDRFEALAPAATVLALRAPGSEPTQVNRALGAGGRAAIDEAYAGAAGGRFDWWLELEDETSVAALAESLGLGPVEHAPVPVTWPDDAPTTTAASDEVVETFNDELHALIEAVPDPSATDSSKWRAVEDLIAKAVGLDVSAVVVGFARDSKNMLNRLRQRSGRAAVRVVIVPTRRPLATPGSTWRRWSGDNAARTRRPSR